MSALRFPERALPLLCAALMCALPFGGCGVVRTVAGANFDAEQFSASRDAAVARVRADAAVALAKRLSSKDPVTNADMVVTLGEAAVNKAAAQVIGIPGRLDGETSYTVRKAAVSLRNGCAIASLGIDARNDAYAVDVKLLLDCALTIVHEKGRLVARLEPFNISPDVEAGGLLAPAAEIIRDVIKARMSRLGSDLPPITLPVESVSTLPVQGGRSSVRTGLNLDIDNPPRVLRYTLRMKEVLIFDGRMLIAMNLADTEAK